MAEIDTSKLKGNSSCHILSDKGRDNYDTIFGKKEQDDGARGKDRDSGVQLREEERRTGL